MQVVSRFVLALPARRHRHFLTHKQHTQTHHWLSRGLNQNRRLLQLHTPPPSLHYVFQPPTIADYID